ncbi:hypothetical protein Pav013_1000 [Pseudomonas syringae pv. avellanae str. ISPaVe013]|nr:hypothetical protein Pav013_1000 [Pseudomonas syringae pv. avellanae str. ISPaVe013]
MRPLCVDRCVPKRDWRHLNRLSIVSRSPSALSGPENFVVFIQRLESFHGLFQTIWSESEHLVCAGRTQMGQGGRRRQSVSTKQLRPLRCPLISASLDGCA